MKIVELKENKQGMIVVMALLILSLIMASSLLVSRLIIGEVRMSVNVANAISSYYAAESGVEQALYYIKYIRDEADSAPFEALYDGDSNPDGEVGVGNFSFASTTLSGYSFADYDITTSTPTHVDVIHPSGDLSILSAGGWDDSIATSYDFSIDWTIEDCFPYHASDRLEITIASFDEDSFDDTGVDADIEKRVLICNCAYDSNDSCDDDISSFSSISEDRYYRYVFRPLDNTVTSLNFTIYGNSSFEVGIPSQAEFTVDGTYGNSEYRISAEIPAIAPLSDIFSYVIFSEEDFIKNL